MALKKGLGRGLEALISAAPEEEREATGKSGVVEVDIHKIEPNRQQPRKYFDDDSLQELANSIREFGVIQPLVVKETGDYYSIIAGERRWRAARLAKISTIPVIIKEYNDLQMLQVALVENIQRKDLNPIEEASCFRRLIDEYFFKQEDIAEKIGRSRQYISNLLSLLALDDRVQNFIIEGKLTAFHGRVLLLARDNPELQYKAADRIIEDGMSARAAEAMIKAMLRDPEPVVNRTPSRADYFHAEQDLKTIFGTKVQIKEGKNNQGKIEIEYYSPDDLDRLLGMMKQLEE